MIRANMEWRTRSKRSWGDRNRDIKDESGWPRRRRRKPGLSIRCTAAM